MGSEADIMVMFRSAERPPVDATGAEIYPNHYHFQRHERDRRAPGTAACSEVLSLEGMVRWEGPGGYQPISLICRECCLARPDLAAKLPGCHSKAFSPLRFVRKFAKIYIFRKIWRNTPKMCAKNCTKY